MTFPFMDADDYMRQYGGKAPVYESIITQDDEGLTFDTNKTPVMFVMEVTKKGTHKYIGDVHFEEDGEKEEQTGMVSTFTCKAKLMKFTGSGRARTKKQAKQIACYELLKHAIALERWDEFMIPADTKDEALELLAQIKPAEEAAASTAKGAAGEVTQTAPAPTNENWVGRLQEYCKDNKLTAPAYEFTGSGKDNAKIFTVHVTVGESRGSGEEKKKAAAKNAAARSLLQILNPDM